MKCKFTHNFKLSNYHSISLYYKVLRHYHCNDRSDRTAFLTQAGRTSYMKLRCIPLPCAFLWNHRRLIQKCPVAAYPPSKKIIFINKRDCNKKLIQFKIRPQNQLKSQQCREIVDGGVYEIWRDYLPAILLYNFLKIPSIWNLASFNSFVENHLLHL